MKKQIFSRLLSLVLTAVMLVGVLPIAVWADASEFSYYIATNADGEYAVIDGYHGDGGNVVVPAEIDGLPVKQIAYGVFSNNYTLTHVTVSEGIEVISGHVFSYSSVKTISLPSTLKTISAQCFIGSDLRELTIPEGVTMIGSGVFADCNVLENVYLEAKAPCAEWDERWAEYCYADIWYDGELVSVCKEEGDFLFRIEGENATLLDYTGDAWSECLVVPETIGDASVTAIGAHAFQDQYYLEEIVLPDTVTEIQYDAFVSCGYLTKLDLPLGLTKIGSNAFKWCKNLQELRIPETVTYIGENAFMAVYATLYFEAAEASADWHENWAYDFCGSTEWSACVHRDVTVDKVDKTCESDGYCRIVCNGCGAELSYEVLEGGHEYVYGVCELCGDVKDVSGDYSYFDNGDGIWIEQYYGSESQVAIPSELDGQPVVAISTYAFAYNSLITDVVIPDTVKLIGGGAFSYTHLTEIRIPASVTEIGLGAFEHSDKLENIYFESSERPEGLDDNWIRDCDADVYYDGVWGAGVEGDYHIELKNGGVRIMRFNGYAPTGVFEIPAEFMGLPVTEIAENAFSGTGDMTGLIIPDTVELIDSWAFGWNGSLVEATIPASVTAIYSEIFSGCEAMENIYCEVGEQPEGWNPNWAGNCAANIWFDGVMKIGTIDGFRVESVDGGLSIIEYVGDETEVVIPAELGGVPVVKIAQQAFSGCFELTSVTIPDTVTFIGSDAFAYTSLTEITIPASVEIMEHGVFWDCDSLQNVYCEAESQPETWDDGWLNACSANLWFDGRFFRGVEGDYRIEIADGGAVIIEYLGSKTEIVIPSELAGYPVTAIADYVFEYYETATSIVLPETVTTIGYRAFYFCTSLVSVTLPEGLSYIGERAFEECFALAEVVIPDGVTEIGRYAFGWCYDLTEITIPASVETMGECVFEECQSLTDVYCEAASQPEGWSQNWLSFCDANLWFDGVLARGWIDGYQINIAEGKVTILDYAGEDTEIVIPYEISGCPVFAIDSEAFSYTETVTSITIPNSVVSIGDYAFAWCHALTEINIPTSVQVMGYSVLWECSSLQNVYCESESKPDGWEYGWADGCNASIWFGGQLVQGVIDGFVIETENDVVTIIDYVGSASELVIPAELNGMPVKTIGSRAFASLDSVTSVVVSEGIEKIGYEAFAYNDSLITVTIPASVTNMDDDVFWNCDQLQNIYCAAESQPEGWSFGWTNGCDATIWFDGVLTQGIIDGFKIMAFEGEVAILGYFGSETAITIPAEIEGMPVVALESNAFSGMGELTSVVIPDSVTFIGAYAFSYCYGLTEITIPASVEFMHNNVFWECGALQNIYCEISEQPDVWNRGWANGCNASIWFDGVLVRGVIDNYSVSTENGEITILRYFGDLKDIIIPAELGGLPVTKIGVSAFSDYYEIESLIIPESIREIGSYAFSECHALTTVVIPDSVLYMGNGIFSGCDAMQVINCEATLRPEGWSSEWASGCNAEIYFDGVLVQGVVDDYMIRTENGEVTILGYVGDATELVIPSELGGMPVKHIGYRAFYTDEQLTSVIIPDGVVSIGYEAFAFCNGLTEITIPASVTTMESDVFWYAQNLQNVYCEAESRPDGWTGGWTNGCEANIYFGGVLSIGTIDGFRISTEDGFATIHGYYGDANEVVIPSELGGAVVTTIGYDAFAYMDQMTSIVLPETLLYINSRAFYECSSLANLILPAGLVCIEDRAFAYCHALIEITIPASVEFIGYRAFFKCNALENIYCEAGEQPASWDENWAESCEASSWFDGVLKIGVIDGFRVESMGGEITILGYVGNAAEVVIPAELAGLPVTCIESCAFSSRFDIMSVVIPDSVVMIGYEAFAYCEGLTEITIPDSVEYLGDGAFYGSLNLQAIYCEAVSEPESWSEVWLQGCDADVYFDGVMKVGVVDDFRVSFDGDQITILGYCGESSDVVILSELNGLPVTRIERSAFSNESWITSVSIPDSIVSIGDYAFAWCYGLTEITIPASVIEMGYDVFYESENIQNIYCEISQSMCEWDESWMNGCDANIYFDGVMTYGTIDGFTFKVENGGASIIGYVGDATALVIPAELAGAPVTRIEERAFSYGTFESVVIPDSVTYIGYRAFAYCDYLTEITIPASVTQMGGFIFRNSYNLQNIYCEAAKMPSGWQSDWANGCNANIYFDGVMMQGVIGDYRIQTVDGEVTIIGYLGDAAEVVIPAEIGGFPVTSIGQDAFDGRDWITSVTIPDSVTHIGYEAFAYCYSLTEITIPASVTKMDGDVFWYCEGLKTIYCEASAMPEGWSGTWLNGCYANVYFDGALYAGVSDGFCFVLEDGGVTIREYLRYEEEIVVPAVIADCNVIRIAEGAFAGRPELKRVVLPETLKSIGAYAFEESGLEEIILPDGLETIENRAFRWSAYLTEITIPASVTFVGERVFGSCDAMQNIYCESGKYVGDWAYNWANGTNANVYVEGALAQGVIDGLKIRTENGHIIIVDYVGSAERVVIPAEIGGVPVTEIGGYAFAECEWITRVTIPDSMTVIGAEAFAWCSGLTEMIIPASVVTMGYDVFWGCASLDSIYCDAVERPADWNAGWEDGCYADIYFDRTLRQGVDNEYLLSFHDGMVTILEYLGSATELIVPEMIGGRTVAAVGSLAFANCLSLTKVTIPAYVTQMGDGIFNECKNLENIYCDAEERPEGWSELWAYGCDANIYFNGTMVQGVAGDYHIRVDEDGVAILSYLKDEEHVVIPAELLGMPVTTIEYNAFGWHSMTSVTIPETVMYIGYEAFVYCENLTEITIPAGVVYMDSSVFWGCNYLQEINCEAGEQPEDWEYGWADGCDADIYFGGKLAIGRVGDYRVEIGENGAVILTYYGTSENVVVPAEIEGVPVVEIAFDAFLGADFSSIVLPDSLRFIGPYAFECCYNLTEITIPASVEYIDACAFGSCEKLQTIRLAENAAIETWESSWYVDCYADIWKGDKKITLTEGDYDVLLLDGGALIVRYTGNDSVLTIPATFGGVPVIAIGAGAFSGKNMTSAVLPDTIKEIGNAAFAECLDLETIVLPKSLQAIGYHAFASCISLTEITIPGSVKNIEDEVFLYCENLKKVVLQEGVLTIGGAAFAVSGLQSIVLPSTLKVIDSYAFAETELTEITIPKSVEKIGELVFDGTTSLRVINCEAKSAPSGWNAYWKSGCDAQIVWGTASDSDCLYGDVNGDGKINGTDVTRLLRYIANRNPLTGESTVEIGEGADCNGDGKITGTDVTRLLRYIANRNPLTGESSVTLGPST